MSQFNTLLDAGFSTDEIRTEAKREFDDLKTAGFTDQEANDYTHKEYGFRFNDTTGAEQSADLLVQAMKAPGAKTEAQMAKAGSAMDTDYYTRAYMGPGGSSFNESEEKGEEPEQSDSFTTADAFKYGWRTSTTSLIMAPPLDINQVDQDDISFMDKLVMQVGQEIGDVPTSVAGAVMGGALGTAATVNPIGGFVGAFAGAGFVTEGMRQHLIDSYKYGAVTSPSETLWRAANVVNSGLWGAYSGAAVGGATSMAIKSAPYVAAGISSALAQKAVQVAAPLSVEATSGAAVGAAIEGRLPTYEDLALGAVHAFGNRATARYTDKLSYSFIKHGASVAETLNRMKTLPDVNEDMRSSNLIQPIRDGGNFTTIFTIRPKRIADDHSWLTMDNDVPRLEQRIKDMTELDAMEMEFLNARNAERTPITERNARKTELNKRNLDSITTGERLTKGEKDELSALFRETNKDNIDAQFSVREKRFYEKEITDSVKELERLKKQQKMPTPGKYWFYTTEAAAESQAMEINKKYAENLKSGTDLGDNEFVVVAYDIPAEQRLIPVHGSEDPLVIDSYKYGMQDTGRAPTDTWDFAVDTNRASGSFRRMDIDTFRAIHNMPANMLSRHSYGGDANAPLSASFPGLKWFIGQKGKGPQELVTIWDKNILTPHARRIANENINLNTASDEVNASISVGEAPQRKNTARHYAERFYTHLYDTFRPLNQGSKRTIQNDSYLAARLFNGVDGVVKHWLYYGRTMFTDSKAFVGGEKTVVAGKSLLETVNSARADVGTMDAQTAMDARTLGQELMNKDLDGLLASKEELESQLERKEISKADYNENMGKILEAEKALTDPNDPLSLFRIFIVARQALALERQGLKSGISIDAANKVANNPYLVKRFREASEELREYQTALLQYRVDSGLMTAKSMKKALANNPDYIPLNRVDTDTNKPRHERDIIDPIESIIRQTQNTIVEAEKNSVIKLIAKEHGTKIPDPTIPEGGQSIEEGQEIRTAEKETPSSEILTFRENGKEMRYRVSPEIKKAADGLSPRTLSALVRFVSAFTKPFRLGTILSLTFSGVNIIRDQAGAGVQSEHGYVPVADMVKGIGALVGTKNKDGFPDADSLEAKWLRSRGSNSSLMAVNRKWTQKNWHSFMQYVKPHNVVPFTQKALNSIANFINPMSQSNAVRLTLDGLGKISEGSEDATRLGEFQRALDAGKSEAEAGMASREITIDFARVGASMQALGAMSAFLNATLQGSDRATRGLMKRPLATVGNVISGIVIPTMLLEMVNQTYMQEDPESERSKALKEGPDWQKEAFWRIGLGDVIFTVPIPHEYMPVANMVRSFVEFMYEEEPDNTFLEKLWAEDYFGNTLKGYMIEPMAIMNAASPTLLSGGLNVAMNHSLFTGQPLVPASQMGLMAPYRFNRNTSPLSLSLSKALYENGLGGIGEMTDRFITPIAIDRMVNSFGGTLGTTAWQILGTGLQKAGILGKDIERSARRLHELPGMRAFFMQFPNSGSSSVEKFFTESGKMSERLDTARYLIKSGLPQNIEEAERILQGGPIAAGLDEIRRQITVRSREIATIDLFPNDGPGGLSPEDKRGKITELQMERIKLAKYGLQIIKSYKQNWEEQEETK